MSEVAHTHKMMSNEFGKLCCAKLAVASVAQPGPDVASRKTIAGGGEPLVDAGDVNGDIGVDSVQRMNAFGRRQQPDKLDTRNAPLF